MLLFLGRNRSIYDRSKRSNLCESPGRAGGLPYNELAQHDCIVLRENNEDVTLWRLRKKRSEVSVRVPAILSSNDGDVVKQWALRGKGLVMRSEWSVADSLADGSLVRVLPEWDLPDANVVALAARRAGMSARARLFLTFLQTRFQPAPPWRRLGGSTALAADGPWTAIAP